MRGSDLSFTFDRLVEVVPVLPPGGDVGPRRLVLRPPQEHALVLRTARQVLPVVAASVEKIQ